MTKEVTAKIMREIIYAFPRQRFLNLLADWKSVQKANGLKYSDAEFCRVIGISRSALAKYKSGKVQPSLQAFAKAVNELEVVPPDYFNAETALVTLAKMVLDILKVLLVFTSTDIGKTMTDINTITNLVMNNGLDSSEQ